MHLHHAQQFVLREHRHKHHRPRHFTTAIRFEEGAPPRIRNVQQRSIAEAHGNTRVHRRPRIVEIDIRKGRGASRPQRFQQPALAVIQVNVDTRRLGDRRHHGLDLLQDVTQRCRRQHVFAQRIQRLHGPPKSRQTILAEPPDDQQNCDQRQHRHQQIRRNTIRAFQHHDLIGPRSQYLEVTVIRRQRAVLNHDSTHPDPIP